MKVNVIKLKTIVFPENDLPIKQFFFNLNNKYVNTFK